MTITVLFSVTDHMVVVGVNKTTLQYPFHIPFALSTPACLDSLPGRVVTQTLYS